MSCSVAFHPPPPTCIATGLPRPGKPHGKRGTTPRLTLCRISFYDRMAVQIGLSFHLLRIREETRFLLHLIL